MALSYALWENNIIAEKFKRSIKDSFSGPSHFKKNQRSKRQETITHLINGKIILTESGIMKKLLRKYGYSNIRGRYFYFSSLPIFQFSNTINISLNL